MNQQNLNYERLGASTGIVQVIHLQPQSVPGIEPLGRKFARISLKNRRDTAKMPWLTTLQAWAESRCATRGRPYFIFKHRCESRRAPEERLQAEIRRRGEQPALQIVGQPRGIKTIRQAAGMILIYLWKVGTNGCRRRCRSQHPSEDRKWHISTYWLAIFIKGKS